ncbi:hypothetical protein LU196_13110 [Pantoea sp. Mb-10]|uniref:hypothetical protein n=1 Tax=unclassified Pantoea TaxID=2630326 RepID=UPI001E5204E9|nr:MULTISPECIES: hypothetical protein [unclassified Pantoea]MCE0490979.1 hypothetical protein [Pantoea sp. Mb-10]MCE0499863.1 hypothetical protein [Pantoea sp. Pb-8]
MNEQELKKFIFSETVKIVAQLSGKPSGLSSAMHSFDTIYEGLLRKAKALGL